MIQSKRARPLICGLQCCTYRGYCKKLLSGLEHSDSDDDDFSEKSDAICKFSRLHVQNFDEKSDNSSQNEVIYVKAHISRYL